MKTLKYIPDAVCIFAVLLFIAGCGEGGEGTGGKVVETMTLTASAESVKLDSDNLNEVALTFTWTPAREMPNEYRISYVTKLDLTGNDFSAITAVRTEEKSGVFSKSYTNLQLQNLLKEKWSRPLDRPTSLDFEILAKWDGGSKYAMPEVRVATVLVTPYTPKVFRFKRIVTNGSAMTGGGQFAQTPENEFVYVWTGELTAGDLEIHLEKEDATTDYLFPVDQDGTVENDTVEDVEVDDKNNYSWSITEAGEYRLVLDVAEKTLKIYTPGNVLKAAEVEWTLNSVVQTTTVTKLWMFGEHTNPWNWNNPSANGEFKQSLVDPQLFIYSGSAKSGRTKFCVATNNASYVYGPVNNTGVKIDTVPAVLGVEYDLGEGTAAYQRDTYFGMPSGTTYITLDIRNKKIKFEKR